MTLIYLKRFVLPAAYELLPPVMDSPEASAMLLAIALQESDGLRARRQYQGPARGFWQFELGGIAGVRRHNATRTHLKRAKTALCYRDDTVAADHAIVEHNDVLACVFARLNLWWVPGALPGRDDVEIGWRQYLAAWNPGKPHPETWPANFARAWAAIDSKGV